MAYERTWQFSFNNAYTPSSGLDLTRYQMWALKAMIKGELGGLTSGLWTCAGSSDSVAAGMDGVDRWLSSYDGTKIVRGATGNIHSWIVLQSPTMNGCTFYICIDFNGGTDPYATTLMSKAPFTGGSVTTRPSSVDEWHLGVSAIAVAAWNSGSTELHMFNLCLSTLGDFVWFVVQAGTAVAQLVVSCIAPTGCIPTDLYPIWAMKRYSGSTSVGGLSGIQLAGITGSSAFATRTAAGSVGWVQFPLAITIATNGVVDSLLGSQIDLPCWVVVTNGTTWHTRGRLPDMGYIPGSSPLYPHGNAVRNGGGAVEYVSMGALFIPANAIPNLS